MRRPGRNRPVGPTSTRSPRYRLLKAAAALPQREPERPSESFDAPCPACGRDVAFTQVQTEDGVEYAIEDHDCAAG